MKDQDLELVNKAINELGEHFDTVHIFVTRHEPSEGGTVSVAKGIGNWYARKGQVHEWCVKNDRYAQMECEENE